MKFHPLTRRQFVQFSIGTAVATSIPGLSSALEEKPTQKNEAGIPIRPLGKTNVKVPILCLGGHHVGQIENDRQAVRLIRFAIDNGVTFLDNAWEYHHGRWKKYKTSGEFDGWYGRKIHDFMPGQGAYEEGVNTGDVSGKL